MAWPPKLPKQYRWDLPIFNEKGTITPRVRTGLENVLAAYVPFAKGLAQRTDNNPENYQIKEVYIVGSGARENGRDSDLDILLIVPTIDASSAAALMTYFSQLFTNGKHKQEWIDVYVRKEDLYPERSSQNITHYVQKLLDKYNKKIK